MTKKKTTEYTIDSLFAGVGGIETGFEQTQRFRTVYANEWDEKAGQTYRANHPYISLDNRDVHKISGQDLPACDVMVGGFPCQAFSIAGYRKGFSDERGHLFFEMLRLIKAKRPQAILIENVKNLIGHDHGNTFQVIREALTQHGYHLRWQVLNSKDYGNVPQNRERLYLIGFRDERRAHDFAFPQSIPLTTALSDIIDFAGRPEERYYYRAGKQKCYTELASSVKSQDNVYQWRRTYTRRNPSHLLPTLTANMGMGGHNVPIILTDTGEIRKLTPYETFRGQGYPRSFQLPDRVSNSQLYKQAGNSVTVPVLRRLAEQIAKALDERYC